MRLARPDCVGLSGLVERFESDSQTCQAMPYCRLAEDPAPQTVLLVTLVVVVDAKGLRSGRWGHVFQVGDLGDGMPTEGSRHLARFLFSSRADKGSFVSSS